MEAAANCEWSTAGVDLSDKPLLMLQTNEYLRAFLTGRIGFNQMGMLLIISGALAPLTSRRLLMWEDIPPDVLGRTWNW